MVVWQGARRIRLAGRLDGQRHGFGPIAGFRSLARAITPSARRSAHAQQPRRFAHRRLNVATVFQDAPNVESIMRVAIVQRIARVGRINPPGFRQDAHAGQAGRAPRPKPAIAALGGVAVLFQDRANLMRLVESVDDASALPCLAGLGFCRRSHAPRRPQQLINGQRLAVRLPVLKQPKPFRGAAGEEEQPRRFQAFGVHAINNAQQRRHMQPQRLELAGFQGAGKIENQPVTRMLSCVGIARMQESPPAVQGKFRQHVIHARRFRPNRLLDDVAMRIAQGFAGFAFDWLGVGFHVQNQIGNGLDAPGGSRPRLDVGGHPARPILAARLRGSQQPGKLGEADFPNIQGHGSLSEMQWRGS